MPDARQVGTTSRRLPAFARTIGVVVAGVGALVLTGWAFQIEALQRIVPGQSRIKVNSAIALVCYGLVLFLNAQGTPSLRRRIAGALIVIVPILLGVLTLIDYATGHNFGIDQFLFADPQPAEGFSKPGRMAAMTALHCVLVGTALLLLLASRHFWLIQSLALASLALATLTLLGHLYGVSQLYSHGAFSSIALHLALLFAALAVGILASRPDRGVMAIYTGSGSDIGSAITRRLLPAAFGVPLTIGWLQLQGQRADYYDTEFGLALFALANMVCFTGLILWTATSLRRTQEQQQRTETALRESDARFHRTFDSMLEGCAIIDFHWKYLYVNGSMAIHARRTREQMLGRRITDVLPGLDQTPIFVVLRRSMEERISQRLEYLYDYPEGGSGWFDVSVQPSPEGIFVLTADITDRKLAEEQIHSLNADLEDRVAERTAQLQAANKDLEAFSYSVSHDLRAPLRAIDGFSRIVLQEYADLLPPEGQDYLRDVRANTKQMGQLVDDLLTFSRLGRKTLARQLVDTADLVQTCLNELQPIMTGRDVDVRIGQLDDCLADPALVKQVWYNLLSNAIKYTSKRQTAVIEIGSDGPTYFIRDNGVGFDMRYAPKLFGVFQRLHKAEDYEGTGVGLAIVQRIIQRHGGRVWAEAEPDRGAAFFFTVPPPPVEQVKVGGSHSG